MRLLLLAVSILAGCATSPEPYTRQVTQADSLYYEHLISNQGDVTVVAMNYCQTRGKVATLQTQMRTSEFRMNTTYLCR